MQCPRCYFSNPSDSRVCEYCGARLEGTTDVGVDRGSSGQKRKTMLGPMPTMARKPGASTPKTGQKKATPIDPDDPFRIAAQGVRSLPEMDAPHARSVVPSQAPEPRPAKQVRTAMRNSGPQESQTSDTSQTYDEGAEPRPVSQVPAPAPPPRSRRSTVVTLQRPEEPSVAGAAIVLPANGPARSVLIREGRTRIGRREGVEIRLDDPKASTDHALLRVEGGEAWLLDTSANGTLVSGTACVNDRADITDGSVLRVGDTLIVLKLLGDDALAHLANEG